jgi:hypothetical protein
VRWYRRSRHLPGRLRGPRRCRLPAFVILTTTITRCRTLILKTVEHSLSTRASRCHQAPS